MSQKETRQRGFTAVEGIVAAIVVLALALGGWWVWERNQSNNRPSTDSSQTNDAQSQNGDPSDPSEGGKYLVITEWGVRFPLPEELRGDIEFSVSEGEDKEGAVIFASKKLNGLTGDNTCALNMQPSGKLGGGVQAILLRINPSTYKAATPEYYQSLRDYVKSLNNYEYYSLKQTKSPPITCLTNQHEEFNDVEQSISNQLKEAFKQIETIE